MENGYSLTPDSIMERKDLTFGHKCVLAVLARIQGKSAFCYPSLQYIANSCGASRAQVKRIVKDLEIRKEIIVLHHARKASTYSVPWATQRNIRRKWAAQRAVS